MQKMRQLLQIFQNQLRKINVVLTVYTNVTKKDLTREMKENKYQNFYTVETPTLSEGTREFIFSLCNFLVNILQLKISECYLHQPQFSSLIFFDWIRNMSPLYIIIKLIKNGLHKFLQIHCSRSED